MLHHYGFYPCYLQRIPGDQANRVRIREWLQPGRHILHDILFMDGFQFANMKNSQSSTHEDLRELAECHSNTDFQLRCGVNY
jgi:hypothetical protein